MITRSVRAAAPLRRRRLVQTSYFQLFVISLVGFFGPLATPYVLSGELAVGNEVWHTQVASLLAAVAALVGYRRVTAYPGTRAFSHILPAFLTTYAIAAATLLIGRFVYSGTMLATGVTLTTGAMFILSVLAQRGAPLQFYIVPGSEGAIVRETPRVRWLLLTEPEVPADASAAIVADLTADYSPEWERMLAKAAISGRVVYHTKQLRESLTGRVQIEHLSENTLGSLLPNLAYLEIKRCADLVVSVIALPLLALPLMLIGLLIRLDSPGPAIFRQRRMGYRGEPFEVLKFRTMRHVTDLAGADPVTKSGDDRITRIGRFLRRTRLDELPQLINVFKGEMSLIGPRPEAIKLSEWYERELPFYAYRHIVRPGITGWAQINQGHVAELDDVLVKLHYDFFYIKNFSAWMDILITLRTIVIMSTGFGSK